MELVTCIVRPTVRDWGVCEPAVATVSCSWCLIDDTEAWTYVVVVVLAPWATSEDASIGAPMGVVFIVTDDLSKCTEPTACVPHAVMGGQSSAERLVTSLTCEITSNQTRGKLLRSMTLTIIIAQVTDRNDTETGLSKLTRTQ